MDRQRTSPGYIAGWTRAVLAWFAGWVRPAADFTTGRRR